MELGKRGLWRSVRGRLFTLVSKTGCTMGGRLELYGALTVSDMSVGWAGATPPPARARRFVGV